MTIETIMAGFHYRNRGALRRFDGWRIMRPEIDKGTATANYYGDCDDLAWTLAVAYAGGAIPALSAILSGKIELWRVHTESNGLVARHVAIRIPGLGWTDSSRPRKWRKEADMDLRGRIRLSAVFWTIWGSPIGKALVAAGVAYAAHRYGLF